MAPGTLPEAAPMAAYKGAGKGGMPGGVGWMPWGLGMPTDINAWRFLIFI